MEDKKNYRKKYSVQAKRKDSKEKWTDWAETDSYLEAKKHEARIIELGYRARIIIIGEKQSE